MHLCKGAVTSWQGAMYLHPAIFLWVQSVAPSKTAGMPKRAGQIPRSFLLPETVFTKEHLINLPLKDGPGGAGVVAALWRRRCKHSADVHPHAYRGHPPDPYAACGRKICGHEPWKGA